MSEPPRGRNLKLELTWVGKDHRPRLEPRILLIDDTLSHTAAARVTDTDQFENMLIFGDNLLALKALATDEKVRGKVKCIFIDPPYNTGSAFENYDDGMEHSLWLSMMRERLELLSDLLCSEGSIWICADDNEVHYLKVLCDEIFGRKRFISDIAWKKRDGAPNDRKIGSTYDHILVYASKLNPASSRAEVEKYLYLMGRTEKADAQYRVFDEPNGPDPKGPFRKIDTTANGKGGRFVQSLYYPITNPYTKQEVWPREGTCWRHNREEMERLQSENRLYWGVKGTATTPMRKLYVSEAKSGMAAPTIWDDLSLNQHAAREIELIFGAKAVFETPKPENLIERVLEIATQPKDLVLDSFAGSGTTGAVAHKMGRRWIMIELEIKTLPLIKSRLQKVIDGTDAGGISSSANWKGGGGFRYYRLAPSLIKKDLRGQYIINPEYNAEMLAEACCKLSGFAYAPSEATWWQHGRSSERDYLFVTTRYLSFAELQDLSEEVGPERSLLVLAKAFDREGEVLGNLSVRKIPEEILGKCEWDHDDYSLKIENLPRAAKLEPEPVTMGVGSRAGRRAALSEPGLFDSLSSGSGEE